MEDGGVHGQAEDPSATCHHGRGLDGSSAEEPAGGFSAGLEDGLSPQHSTELGLHHGRRHGGFIEDHGHTTIGELG